MFISQLVPKKFLQQHGIQVSHPLVFKSCFTPFCFYKRPTLEPVFENVNKFKEDFRFYKKGQKVKVALSIWLTVPLQRQCTQSRGSGPAELLRNHTRPLSIELPELWPVSVTPVLHLNWICASLSRCVLRWLLFRFTSFQLTKVS